MSKYKKAQSEETREVVNFLNQILADEQLLLLKTRRAHWNVEGPDFHAMHLFFEKQYNELDEWVDQIAERVRMLGHYSVGTMNEYLSMTHILESEMDGTHSSVLIKDLLINHEAIIVYIKSILDEIEKLKDQGTEDFLVGLLQAHEKMSWMLQAHLR
ncbi:Dps family protein [Gynurincola endophyticus]|jgi:starvation-inducible DNA-binding protein|uniref:Dps family protein n=1 Tax=Gynurincola endophyticus TaxID=2479004 RepID=UPI000F8E5247|nr:DNA starvation/stationary phase protection protein [Gynurincola endophyticus]